MNILLNLPPSFFAFEEVDTALARFDALGEVRRRSHVKLDELMQDLPWAKALILWSWPTLDEEALAKVPQLKFIGHIDISLKSAQAALNCGLAVSLAKRGWSPAVAEMALGLILSTLRKLTDYHLAMRDGTETWDKWPTLLSEVSTDERLLADQTVGLIGFGGVGRRLRRLLDPFGCPVKVYDPYLTAGNIRAAGAEKVELDRLMADCDVIVLCAAATAEAKGLIGQPQLQAMRPGAVLVNVSRGHLVDTDALVDRLRQGDVFAALDVFDPEPLPADHPLRSLPNAYLTPHRGGGLRGSMRRIINQLADDLTAFANDEPRQHALTQGELSRLDA